MSKLQLAYFQIHILLSVMLFSAYIVFMNIHKDELEEKAQSYALKTSNLLTTVSVVFYVLYKTVMGDLAYSIHTVLFIVNILCGLYLLFYFLYMKGIVLSFKIKNTKILDVICYLSTAASIIFTITGFLKVKIFELSSSFIRLDTLLMMINFIVVSLLIGLYPKKKLNRQEYKEAEVTANKYTKIFVIIFGLFYLGLIVYAIYKICTR